MYLLFFASGFASLADEVVWFKLLDLTFGVTTLATATLLAVFMAHGLLLFPGEEDEMETLTEVVRVSPSEVRRRLERGEPLTFVDARNPKAWGDSDVKLPGAIRVPADDVESRVREIPRGRPVVAYCT